MYLYQARKVSGRICAFEVSILPLSLCLIYYIFELFTDCGINLFLLLIFFQHISFILQVLLLVNVAGFWGSTPQYYGLNALQETYKNFQIIGIPSNIFGKVIFTIYCL